MLQAIGCFASKISYPHAGRLEMWESQTTSLLAAMSLLALIEGDHNEDVVYCYCCS